MEHTEFTGAVFHIQNGASNTASIYWNTSHNMSKKSPWFVMDTSLKWLRFLYLLRCGRNVVSHLAVSLHSASSPSCRQISSSSVKSSCGMCSSSSSSVPSRNWTLWEGVSAAQNFNSAQSHNATSARQVFQNNSFIYVSCYDSNIAEIEHSLLT